MSGKLVASVVFVLVAVASGIPDTSRAAEPVKAVSPSGCRVVTYWGLPIFGRVCR